MISTAFGALHFGGRKGGAWKVGRAYIKICSVIFFVSRHAKVIYSHTAVLRAADDESFATERCKRVY